MKTDRNRKKKDRPTYSAVENVLFLWKRIARVYPLLLLLMGIQCMFSVISPVVGIYLPRVAVELATQRAGLSEIMVRLGGMGLLLALSMGLASMARMGKYKMQNNLRFEYRVELFMKALSCEYEKIESAEGMRKYNRAWYTLGLGDMSGTTQMNSAVVELFINLSCFVIYSGIIARLDFAVILLLVGLSLVNLLAVRYASAYEFRHKDEEAGISNRLNYIEWTANDVQYGKDIRLYGMESWFLRLREQVMEAYTRLNHRIRNRYFGADIVNAATLFLRDGIVYACLIGSVVSGKIDAGDFVVYFGAVTGFSGFVGRIVDSLNTLNRASLLMNDMRAFLDSVEEPAQRKRTRKEELPEREVRRREARQREAERQEQSTEQGVSIDFENVTFSYDKESQPVLQDFNLHIKRGEKIALVGVNGVGKTTVVKLLCGFYRPDAGRVLLNGRDIREFPREELYELFSTVFQDVYLPPFTVMENISMRPEGETDMERVVRCLEEAGLYEKICEYPEGIHSYMLKAVHDGIVLSGGQQQRLLVARALYRDAPVLILDEPTAALDPVAESETYENFYHFSREKTAIYISHRLASTRFCDRIVLLGDGRVKEEGTHGDLMRQGGEYARMYEIQSQYYKKESRTEFERGMV